MVIPLQLSFTGRIGFYGCFTGYFTDDMRAFRQRFLYRHRIQLLLLCVLAFELAHQPTHCPDDRALRLSQQMIGVATNLRPAQDQRCKES